jgi:hypothetical protein
MARDLKLKIETCKYINSLWNHILYQRFLVWDQEFSTGKRIEPVSALENASIVSGDSSEVTDCGFGWL